MNPPNLLRQKVTGSGPISEEMVKRAERAVESLSQQFDDLLEGELERLSELCALGTKEPARRLDVAKQIFDIAHDLRGQAGTFDYPLITRVGSSLCHFTEGLDSCSEREMQVIRLHVEAMHAILASALRGDDSQVGHEIADGLEKAVEKILA